jgi:hypothetical protein
VGGPTVRRVAHNHAAKRGRGSSEIGTYAIGYMTHNVRRPLRKKRHLPPNQPLSPQRAAVPVNQPQRAQMSAHSCSLAPLLPCPLAPLPPEPLAGRSRTARAPPTARGSAESAPLAASIGSVGSALRSLPMRSPLPSGCPANGSCRRHLDERPTPPLSRSTPSAGRTWPARPPAATKFDVWMNMI